ncbi:hypothetical protein [Labilibacter marinus]|uniref:hypothetical protein n=1 Tax=Labilibacter marinus TaxID=1477105 RepID=UPI0008335734|nr:hypothetical protein [Labilibacter marinus]
MKKYMLKSFIIMVLIAVLTPLSIIAQHNHVKVEVLNEEGDSVTSNYFYRTMFNVGEVNDMHKKLDSIFSTLDKDLNKRIEVIAFNNDSIFNQYRFEHNLDSVLLMHKLSTNDKRINALIRSHSSKPGKQVWVFDENDMDSTIHKNMNIEVVTDSMTENGKTVIKKRVIVMNGSDGRESPIVIKHSSDGEGADVQQVMAYSSVGTHKYPGETIRIVKGDKKIKAKGAKSSQKFVAEIPISDAEVLVRGGVSPKVITGEALHPNDIAVHVKVKEEFGKEVKTAGLYLTFEDVEDMQVKILDRNGRILFEEVKKKFTGEYKKDIEMKNALSPYYFVVVRNKQLFARMIGD